MDRHKPLHDFLDPHPRADGMPRPQVTMTLDQDSPLAQGRLPVKRRLGGGRLEIRVDAVALAALLASVGRLFTVAQTEAYLRSRLKVRKESTPEGTSGEGLEGERA